MPKNIIILLQKANWNYTYLNGSEIKKKQKIKNALNDASDYQRIRKDPQKI